MKNQSKIPRLKSSLNRLTDQTNPDSTSEALPESIEHYNGVFHKGTHPRKDAVLAEKRATENFDNNASCFSLPSLVDKEVEDAKKDNVLTQEDENRCSCLSRYTTLPPILSDINPKHPISFMVPHSSSKPVRRRLPPIDKQQQEEKPDFDSRLGRKKETMKSKIEEERELREIKRKIRLREHEKKRKEIDESCEANRLRILEQHRQKLDLADRNKEQIRQQRKRKLEYQEERRRRAREKLSLQQKLWCEDYNEEDIDDRWTDSI